MLHSVHEYRILKVLSRQGGAKGNELGSPPSQCGELALLLHRKMISLLEKIHMYRERSHINKYKYGVQPEHREGLNTDSKTAE